MKEPQSQCQYLSTPCNLQSVLANHDFLLKSNPSFVSQSFTWKDYLATQDCLFMVIVRHLWHITGTCVSLTEFHMRMVWLIKHLLDWLLTFVFAFCLVISQWCGEFRNLWCMNVHEVIWDLVIWVLVLMLCVINS